METLSHLDLQALNRAIGEIYAARDMESYYRAVFTSIQSVIPSEYASFTDLRKKTNHIMKLTMSSDARQNVTIKLKPVLDEHFFSHPLMSSRFSNNVAKVSDFVSKNQFKGTALYTDYYRHMEIDAQITFSVPVSQELISHVTLSRNGKDFSERDRLILTLLRSHLITALRNVIELEKVRLERDLLQRGEQVAQKGAVLFEPGGMVLCITAFAFDLLAKFFGVKVIAGESMPEVLRRWLQDGTDYGTLATGRSADGVVCCVDRNQLNIIKDDGCLLAKLAKDVLTGDLMLFLVETPTMELQLEKMGKYGLSQRESEVVVWLTRGKTNPEVAIILGISKRTVEKHLEKIYEKLGVETRAAAVEVVRKELV